MSGGICPWGKCPGVHVRGLCPVRTVGVISSFLLITGGVTLSLLYLVNPFSL